MKKIGIVFVGVGGFGAVNLKNFLEAKREDAEIVATVDPFAPAPLAAPHFKTLEEMYASGVTPALAVISTPIRFHTDQILLCLEKGTNVMCEKPVTGDIADLPLLLEAEEKSGCFVAIGYQWSYSKAITALKADIARGLYGKPVSLKTIILWPRDKAYFNRSTGWAGKIMHDGKKILDSVMNNATAHYLHNILYILGDKADTSVFAADIKASLLRVNPIETFDTVTASFALPEGAQGFFVASHATERALEPTFLYEFTKGSVSFSETDPRVVGRLSDGTEIDYGDPFASPADKIVHCVELIKSGEKTPLCGIRAASAQAEFIAALHESCAIADVSPTLVTNQNERLFVEGFGEALVSAYENKTLLDISKFTN